MLASALTFATVQMPGDDQRREWAFLPLTRLAVAYQRVRATSGDGVLGIGDVGPDVAGLQRALQRCGFPAIVDDGDFGRRTANAVEQVQAVHRLPVTGRVDPRTAIALGLV